VEWRAAEPTWAHRQWVRASDWGAIELDVLTW